MLDDAESDAESDSKGQWGRKALSRATPAMMPCIGFAQASAGDVKIIRHNDAVWWMALAWDGDEGRGKLR
jgi:hypothetical protein